MKDTCPNCQVVGDFHSAQGFVPSLIWCGNCQLTYPYIPSYWERLDRDMWEGPQNPAYLKPRWRTPPVATVFTFTWPSPSGDHQLAVSPPISLRKQIRGLVDALQAGYGDRYYLYSPERERHLRKTLAALPHVEFDRRKSSTIRRKLAKQNHGMSKSKNR